MEHGADARYGLYPHNEATSPLAIALARGYRDIEAVIREGERRRRGSDPTPVAGDEAEELFRTVMAGDEQRAVVQMERNLALSQASTVEGWTPLHAAAFTLHEPLVAWLLERGADPNQPGREGLTALDAAATGMWRRHSDRHQRFVAVAGCLRQAGAAMTARAAVALGDQEWVRARYAEGALPGPLDAVGGLLRVAVTHDQPEMLAMLLDLGFDPDERVRVPGIEEVEHTWGFPLWE